MSLQQYSNTSGENPQTGGSADSRHPPSTVPSPYSRPIPIDQYAQPSLPNQVSTLSPSPPGDDPRLMTYPPSHTAPTMMSGYYPNDYHQGYGMTQSQYHPQSHYPHPYYSCNSGPHARYPASAHCPSTPPSTANTLPQAHLDRHGHNMTRDQAHSQLQAQSYYPYPHYTSPYNPAQYSYPAYPPYTSHSTTPPLANEPRNGGIETVGPSTLGSVIHPSSTSSTTGLSQLPPHTTLDFHYTAPTDVVPDAQPQPAIDGTAAYPTTSTGPSPSVFEAPSEQSAHVTASHTTLAPSPAPITPHTATLVPIPIPPPISPVTPATASDPSSATVPSATVVEASALPLSLDLATLEIARKLFDADNRLAADQLALAQSPIFAPTVQTAVNTIPSYSPPQQLPLPESDKQLRYQDRYYQSEVEDWRDTEVDDDDFYDDPRPQTPPRSRRRRPRRRDHMSEARDHEKSHGSTGSGGSLKSAARIGSVLGSVARGVSGWSKALFTAMASPTTTYPESTEDDTYDRQASDAGRSSSRNRRAHRRSDGYRGYREDDSSSYERRRGRPRDLRPRIREDSFDDEADSAATRSGDEGWSSGQFVRGAEISLARETKKDKRQAKKREKKRKKMDKKPEKESRKSSRQLQRSQTRSRCGSRN